MGAKMFTWKVGRANAARKLRELDGVWGGELAGHYYFRDFFYSDSGLLASILVLRVLANMKKKGITFSQLIGKIARYQNSGEINFRLEDKKGSHGCDQGIFHGEGDSYSLYGFRRIPRRVQGLVVQHKAFKHRALSQIYL